MSSRLSLLRAETLQVETPQTSLPWMMRLSVRATHLMRLSQTRMSATEQQRHQEEGADAAKGDELWRRVFPRVMAQSVSPPPPERCAVSTGARGFAARTAFAARRRRAARGSPGSPAAAAHDARTSARSAPARTGAHARAAAACAHLPSTQQPRRSSLSLLCAPGPAAAVHCILGPERFVGRIHADRKRQVRLCGPG